MSRRWKMNLSRALFVAVYTVYVQTMAKADDSRNMDRVVTKLHKPVVVTKTGLRVPESYWGTYRSGDYFGVQARDKNSPVFGVMWFKQPATKENVNLRFWCKMEDGMKRYGWLKHDGLNFGYQELVDDDVLIKTSFVKRPGGDFGGDWTARISAAYQGTSPSRARMSFLFFTATNGHANIMPHVRSGSHLVSLIGHAKALGDFSVHYTTLKATARSYNFLETKIPPGMQNLEQIITSNLFPNQTGIEYDSDLVLIGNSISNEIEDDKDHLLVHQVTFEPPFDSEIIFESHSHSFRTNRLEREAFDVEMNYHTAEFDRKFEEVFQLREKGYEEEDVAAAKAILSNMLGTVGFFYGRSLVQSSSLPEPIEYFPAELYTGVPSRSGFPRGFLWDEGFHNLLISRWNSEISKDILGHWLDLMNIDGWIPREQILGNEARTRVPAEFLVEHNSDGNPPAIMLSFNVLLERMRSGEIPTDNDFLLRAFVRLEYLFRWLTTTQAGKIDHTYRWMGRNASNIFQLNAATLASGLDDYPRASHPTDDERHLDLRCWIAYSAQIMKNAAIFLDLPSEKYEHIYERLSNETELNSLHWSETNGQFLDYGLHTDNVTLENAVPVTTSPGQPVQNQRKVRVVWSEPKLQFIGNFGYVSLFPLLTQILSPDNPALEKVLLDIRNRTLLWTDYGLRSLATSAPMYMKYNSDTEAPYWRAPIWINLNYMAMKALRFYGSTPGPFQQMAMDTYNQLRSNVVGNILKEFRDTGYIWEQYNDITGNGQGNHPFTGWSATAVLMMAEIF